MRVAGSFVERIRAAKEMKGERKLDRAESKVREKIQRRERERERERVPTTDANIARAGPTLPVVKRKAGLGIKIVAGQYFCRRWLLSPRARKGRSENCEHASCADARSARGAGGSGKSAAERADAKRMRAK
jgi:hypothetical protein